MASESFEFSHIHLNGYIQICVFIIEPKEQQKVYTDMQQIKLYTCLYIIGGFMV